ncbi:MAG: hypothetical protein DRP74_02945 [Candidatus Omnitrophota bacterium]|nr:MAG: hypothetical protein DRP74_02945 [Candidatus Omnitrophota bacterium]
MRKLFFIFIVISALSFILYIPGLEAIQLSVQEGKVRLSIPPGASKSGSISVKNTSTEPVDIRVYLEDWRFVSSQDGSKEFKPPGTYPFSCAEWINFSPAEFNIPPFGKKEVRYMVEVPDGASGGHYAVMFFESFLSDNTDKENIGVGVALRMGSLFYVEPEGTIKREAVLSGLAVKREDSGFALTFNFENTGNTDIVTEGSFHIIDKSGMVYARGELSQVYTFPGDKGVLQAQWQEPLPAGKYDLVVTLDLGKSKEGSGLGKGPLMVKEAMLQVSASGEILSVGQLK